MLRFLLLLAFPVTLLTSVSSAQVTHGCYGDGTGRICKCDNSDALNPSTGGCLNSAGTGAALTTNGNIGIADNDLQFSMTGGVPGSLAVLLSGDNALGGGIGILGLPESDGLRCVGVNLSRHGARALNGFGDNSAAWGAPLTGPVAGVIGQAGFVSGQTRHFQVRYRDDPNASPCGFGTNTTQSISITFIPMTPVEPCDATAQMACIASGFSPCTVGVGSAACGPLLQVCGNGVLEPGEQCDDGNLVNGDGCDSSCMTSVEPCDATAQMACIAAGNEPCTVGVNSADCGPPVVDPCTADVQFICHINGDEPCTVGVGSADCGAPLAEPCTPVKQAWCMEQGWFGSPGCPCVPGTGIGSCKPPACTPSIQDDCIDMGLDPCEDLCDAECLD